MIRLRSLTPKGNSRGNILLLVAISIVLLLGLTALVVDLGQVYVARQRAQNAWGLALHTGDLAAAESQATLLATNCAAGNNAAQDLLRVVVPGSGVAGVAVEFPQGSITDDAGRAITVQPGEAIRTRGSVIVSYGFARIIGLSTREVSASATAICQRARGLCSDLYMPFAASDQAIFGNAEVPPIEFGQLYPLHVNHHTEGFLGPGNYLALSFPGDSGASDYRDRLGGDKGVMCLSSDPPTPMNTKPGSMGNPTYTGLMRRFAKETDPRFVLGNSNAWQNWLASYDPATGRFAKTWRMGIVPVIVDTIEAVNGNKPVEVAGLAAFFIDKLYDGHDGIHDKGDVEGYFIQGIVSGTNVRWVFPATGSVTPSPQLMWTVRLAS
jgi:hypothetical protein